MSKGVEWEKNELKSTLELSARVAFPEKTDDPLTVAEPDVIAVPACVALPDKTDEPLTVAEPDVIAVPA